MDIFNGHNNLEFEEQDLATPYPACLAYVAAALTAGWRLARDGAANHIDALIGPKHIQDFKRAPKAKLRRVVTWRFVSASLVVEGELMTVDRFMQRCVGEPPFYRAMQSMQWYQQWLDLLKQQSAKGSRHLFAQDTEAHDRQLIVPMHQPSLSSLVLELANQYEDGLR